MKVGTVAGKKTRLLSSLLFSLFFFFSSCHYIFLPFLSSSFILPRCLVWGIGVWLSVEEDRGCLDFNDGLDDNLDLVRDLDAWPVYLIENCSLIHQFFWRFLDFLYICMIGSIASFILLLDVSWWKLISCCISFVGNGF